MLSYCLNCRKTAGSKNPEVSKAKKGKSCYCTDVQFVTVKKQFHQRVRSLWIIESIRNQNSFEQDFLWEIFLFKCIKMNNIIIKLFLAGDRFIPGINLRQPGFTYSPW